MTASIVTKVYKNLIIGLRGVFLLFLMIWQFVNIEHLEKVRIQFQGNRNTFPNEKMTNCSFSIIRSELNLNPSELGVGTCPESENLSYH